MADGAKIEFEPRAEECRGGSFSGLGAPVLETEVRPEQRLREAIERGVDHLLSLQADEGYWVGELQADTTLESDYILYLHILGRMDPGRVSKLANYIRRRQLPHAGWSIYEGGPAGLNA